MGKVFEAVDKLENFISEAEIAYAIPIESIELHYNVGDMDMTWLDKNLIRAFNIYENKNSKLGYLILPEDNKFNAEGLTEYLSDSNLKQIIVNLNDGTTNIYDVIWNVPFESIGDGAYIMLFESMK